jgi:hypothetical protein
MRPAGSPPVGAAGDLPFSSLPLAGQLADEASGSDPIP